MIRGWRFAVTVAFVSVSSAPYRCRLRISARTTASRVALYVVIPPLAWISAAIVENLVSNVLR
jgi:hypothetical protein